MAELLYVWFATEESSTLPPERPRWSSSLAVVTANKGIIKGLLVTIYCLNVIRI